ncbi:CC0125/CC1285 family lipoprotein [Pseudoalteromonas luteoviolacea]|uniref:CC0125/CC1285 family lipoprotein n=1 Tax=Pseudoalteromonas luteoviolacea TaxID=43657 RepID=UPI0026A5E8BA
MLIRRLVLATMIFSLAGCMSHVYQPYNILSGGFSEEKISENHYSVEYEGNPNLERQKTIDFTLLRAAVIAQKAGAPSFQSSRIDAKTTRVHSQYGTSEFTNTALYLELLKTSVTPKKSGCWAAHFKVGKAREDIRFIHDTASCIEELKTKLELTDDQIFREK